MEKVHKVHNTVSSITGKGEGHGVGLLATSTVGSIYWRAFTCPGWPPALLCSPLFVYVGFFLNILFLCMERYTSYCFNFCNLDLRIPGWGTKNAVDGLFSFEWDKWVDLYSWERVMTQGNCSHRCSPARRVRSVCSNFNIVHTSMQFRSAIDKHEVVVFRGGGEKEGVAKF